MSFCHQLILNMFWIIQKDYETEYHFICLHVMGNFSAKDTYQFNGCYLTSIWISIMKIRWPHGHLICIMGILMPEKMVFMLKWNEGLLNLLSNSSLGLAGGKHYQKITFPVFRFVLQNFTIPGYFPYILFYPYILSLLSSGWFVIAVPASVSVRELVKY